jgi:hypothetical protein
MSINMPTPPKESVQALVSTLQKLPSGPGGGRAALSLEDDRSLESSISYPHKVYNLGLKDIAGGKGIEAAHFVSWRYLISQGARGTAAAEVNCDEKQKNQFSQLNQGAFAGGTLEEIRRVVDDPEFEKGSYELRVLRVPALYVIALWLADQQNHNDALIPIPPTNEALKPSQVYTPKQFIAVLRQPAQQKLDFDSSPRLERAR